MGKKAKITAGEVVMEMEFNDSETALAVRDVLPIKACGNTWGDEIYFSIPVVCELEDPKEVVALGDIGYWPSGNAFCIFFGKTPASRGDEIRPASAVNIIGKLLGNPEEFKKVKSGSEVTIERLQD